MRMDTAERRARLVRRHHLDRSGQDGVVDVAGGLVALHSTDACSVFLSIAARTTSVTPADIERVLYDERSLTRMLGMRRTVFVVPSDVAPVVQAACADGIAKRERDRLVQMLGDAGLPKQTDLVKWLATVEAATIAALAARGEATAAQLCDDVPELRTQFLFGAGKRWEGMVGLSTRLLFVLAAEGRIVRGRPRGTWSSTQYRWYPAPDATPRRAPEAERELARLWLQAFGPAPLDDLRWWTGWTVATVKRAVAALDTATVELDGGGTGIVLACDTAPTKPKAKPTAALLPALDPTVMGWKERSWFLDPAHVAALFDRSGNAGPTVWWDGRVVGGWAQRKDTGEIVWRLLEDVGKAAQTAIAKEAERLQAWLGPARVTPRFRTPLERELSA